MNRYSKLRIWYWVNVCRVIRCCLWLNLPEVVPYWVADVSGFKPGALALYRADKFRLKS